MIAPTGIRSGSGASSFASFSPEWARLPSGAEDLAQVAVLSQALGGRDPNAVSPALERAVSLSPVGNLLKSAPTTRARIYADSEGSVPRLLAQHRKTDDYLRSTRTAPLSSYEIKAGWEIPAGP